MDRLLTFLVAFSTLVLKPPFSHRLFRRAIYLLLWFISRNLTTRFLAVTGAGSVDECDRLSQLGWPFGTLYYSHTYLLIYLHTASQQYSKFGHLCLLVISYILVFRREWLSHVHLHKPLNTMQTESVTRTCHCMGIVLTWRGAKMHAVTHYRPPLAT